MNKTKRRILSILLTLALVLGLMPGMGLTAYAAANKTITWDSSNWDGLFSEDETGGSHTDENGITASGAAFWKQLNDNLVYVEETYVANFSISNGKFSSIEIKYDEKQTLQDLSTGWTDNGNSLTWTGESNEVTLSGVVTVRVTSIVFVVTVNEETPSVVSVTGVELDKTSATMTVGDTETLTATVSPDDATDKKVKWSVGGTDAGAVALYSNADCTTEVGTDATSTLTVYAKGISAGSATVTATSNADSTKSASCDVTVSAAAQEASADLRTVIVGFFTQFDPEFVKMLIRGDSFDEYPVRDAFSVKYNGEDGDITYSKTSDKSADITISHGGNKLRFSVSIETDPETGDSTTVVGEVTYTGDEPTTFSLSFDPNAIGIGGPVETSVYPAPAAPEYADKLVEITDHETLLIDLGIECDMSKWGVSITQEEAIALAQYMSAQNNGANCAVLYNVEYEYELYYAVSDGGTDSLTAFDCYTLDDFLPGYKVYYVPVAKPLEWKIGDSINMPGKYFYSDDKSTVASEGQDYTKTVPTPTYFSNDKQWRFETVIGTVNLFLSIPSDRTISDKPLGFKVKSGDGSEDSPYSFELMYSADYAVDSVSLDKETESIAKDEVLALTATILPENATDKTVKWSVGGTDAGAVTLYTDADCTPGNEVGANATDKLTVYAKGISAGSATVTATSNADSEKKASCDVTVSAGNTTFNPASSYTDFNNLITNDTEVTINEVSGKAWYVIACDASTVTLLSKQSFGNQAFNNSGTGNDYATSDIKTYVDELTGEGQPLAGISSVISDLTLIDIITARELSATKIKGAGADWWLCSRSTNAGRAACVYGGSGSVSGYGYGVNDTLGVRPALKLDLSMVSFDSATNTFSLAEEATTTTTVVWSSETGSFDQSIVSVGPAIEYDEDQWQLALYDERGIFTTSQGVFTKIEIDGGYWGDFPGNGEGWNGGIWTGSASSVPFSGCLTNAHGDNNFTITFTIDTTEDNTKQDPAATDFTFTAPSDLVYDGDAKSASVEAATGVSGMGEITVKYFSDDAFQTEVQAEDVKAPGTYYVAIDVTEGDDYNAATNLSDTAWTFTITKAAPTASDFTFTAPTSLGYDGNAKTATVAVNDGITGMGTVTVKYYSDAARTTEVTAANVKNATTYYVGIAVAEGTNYSAATALFGDGWDFTVTKADPTADAPTGVTATYGQTLADVALINPIGNTDGTWAWVDSTQSVGNVVTPAATFKATFTPDSSNYKTVEDVDVAVTVDKAESTPATVTANDLTYDGTDKTLVTVDDSTLVGGEMQYALGTATEATGTYSTAIPTGKVPDTYYVWYKVIGDENHNNSTPDVVEVKINPVDKTELKNAIDDATEYYAIIANAENYKGIAEILDKAIGDASDVANNNTATEAEVGSALIDLLEVWDDVVVVKDVIDQVAALPESNKISDEDIKKILAAGTAFDGLKEAQQKLVPDALIAKLTACEEVLAGIYADKVDDIEDITSENIKDVKAMLAAYDALTDNQKDVVDRILGRSGKDKLNDLKAALKVAEKIEKLEDAIYISLKDEDAIRFARTAYDLLTDSQQALISKEVLTRLENAEEALAEVKEEYELLVAMEKACQRLEDYADTKALADFTETEAKYYKDMVDAASQPILEAKNDVEVEKCLATAKANVDAALATILEDRAADQALADAMGSTVKAIEEAENAKKDPYASEEDKDEIDKALKLLNDAIAAAGNLPTNATATQKKEAAKAIAEAVENLDAATDLAVIHAAIAQAEEADAAAQLKAAKEAATGRLEDYAQAKAMADATESEKDAYNAVVTAGLKAIDEATTPEEVATELNRAKEAVDEVIESLKKARADKQAMDEANDAVWKATEAAASARSEAAKAKGNVYISEDDKKAIDDADEKLMAALNKTTQFPVDVTAIQKKLVAKEIQDAAEKLLEVVNAANENSAATKVEADKLAAAKEIAIGRLTDYAQAKVLADATVDELKKIDQVVADGQKAINEAKDREEVAEVLEIAKAAVDVVFEEIAEARAEKAAMEEATAAIWNAVDVAGTARNVAATSKSNPYISNDDLKAINDAETELLDAIDAIEKLPVDATAEQKMLVAKAILDAADKLTAATMLADINSAAAEEVADALVAAKETATDRLNDYAEAKALANMSEEEKNTYNGVIADGLKAIADAQDVETVKAAVVSAKHVIDTVIEEFKVARAAEEIAKETMEAADQKLADSLVSAAAVEVVAEEVAANEYVSADDKKAIETAIQALNDAIVAASELPKNATADQKNDAAKAIEDATKALDEAADKAVLNAAVAKALADAEQVIAEELAAAKTHANERLSDYSRAKTMSDATKAEKAAISKPVTDGETAINAAKDKAAVANALSKAMTAVDKAVAKIEKDRANAAAAKAVTDMFNKLPAKAKVKVSDKEAINEALAAYKALTKVQKKLVTEKAKNRFRNARAGLTIAVNKAAAKKVTDKIKKLPAAKNVKKSNRNAIVAARTAYKALTKAQKKYVTEKTKNKLKAAINALKKLK